MNKIVPSVTFRAPFSNRAMRLIRPLFKGRKVPLDLESVTFKCTCSKPVAESFGLFVPHHHPSCPLSTDTTPFLKG